MCGWRNSRNETSHLSEAKDSEEPMPATKEHRDAVEALALRIYDTVNPDSERVINMGKADCIREAERRLALRKQPRKRALPRKDRAATDA